MVAIRQEVRNNSVYVRRKGLKPIPGLHVSVAIVATDLCRSPNLAQATINVRFAMNINPVIKVNSVIVPLCQLPITASS
jgi:hypothetical protein